MATQPSAYAKTWIEFNAIRVTVGLDPQAEKNASRF